MQLRAASMPYMSGVHDEPFAGALYCGYIILTAYIYPHNTATQSTLSAAS